LGVGLITQTDCGIPLLQFLYHVRRHVAPTGHEFEVRLHLAQHIGRSMRQEESCFLICCCHHAFLLRALDGLRSEKQYRPARTGSHAILVIGDRRSGSPGQRLRILFALRVKLYRGGDDR
jgi:hypothetical protein